MKIALCAAVVAAPFLLAATVTRGATVRVPAEHATIQEAVAAASAGDTVLVAPGRYTELIQLKNGVTLLAAEGPDSTVLVSPRLGEKPSEERLVEVPAGCDRSTVIEGFSMDPNGMRGCAIYCEESSPTIRGNRIQGFGWGIHLHLADARIEENSIHDCGSFGILIRGSSPEIFRNDLHSCSPQAIILSGNESRPVIGGSAENANRIYGNVPFAIVNQSRNDIDATWNDWGWETAVEMDAKGFPADIAAIQDGNDHGQTHRGKGKVDYRHWISPAAKEAPSSRALPVVPIAIAVVLVVAVVVLSRMRKRAA